MSEKNVQGRFQDDILVVKTLQKVGIDVQSVYDLVNSPQSYKAAIPILLKLLPKVTEEVIKEGIVRALTVKEAKGIVTRPLIHEFGCVDKSQLNLKWAIGNALSVVADNDVFDEIVDLVLDERHGQAREMLALALANMKNPQAVDILIELLKDEEVAGHAIMALGKLKVAKAQKAIEPFLDHQKSWMRKEASKALSKIKKSQDMSKARHKLQDIKS